MAAASVDEGYDDEQFECSVPQNLHCAICLNVLKQPMQCVRNEHSFCKPCIHRHLQETQKCPTCIEPLTLETLRPSRVVSGLLSELMIKCDNFARGCQETMKLEMLPAHVAANCEYSPVKCSNRGCEVIVNRRDQHDHEINQCEFRLEQCRAVCGEQVNYYRRELHCYVTRKEMDEEKQSLKETKDEMSSIKDIVVNLSRELTRHMGDAKKQMGEMKKQMGDVKKHMDDIKSDIGALKNNVEGTGAVGQTVAHVEKKVNAKEDIIVAGGGPMYRPTISVEVFSWTTRQWTRLSSMLSGRLFSSSFVHRGHMYVCGGMRSGGISMEVLQLGQDGAGWRDFPVKLPHNIHGHTCVVYEDSLFIFGGYSDGKVTNDIYKISLVAPYSSQVVGHMPEPRVFHGAQCFGDMVAIVGGTKSDLRGSLKTVLVYGITRNCCITLAPLPFAVSHMATVAWKDNIIILGGQDKNGDVLNAVVKYNVTNGKSERLPAMKHKRHRCSAVITGNMIVVMGGFDEEERFLNSAECFNLDLYTWEELLSMNEARHGATAVLKCI